LRIHRHYHGKRNDAFNDTDAVRAKRRLPITDTVTRPPREDPFTPEELSKYDGTVDSKPVYVAVKGSCVTPDSQTGTIFDVTPRKEMYCMCLTAHNKAPGKGYSIFAGKDASRALGMSSLKPEHAVSDYTTLTPQQMKVLDDWVRAASMTYTAPGSLNITKRYKYGNAGSSN